MTTTTYRDDLAPAELRREELLERRRRELVLVAGEVEDIHGARLGRIAFGAVAVVGALIMGALGVIGMVASGWGLDGAATAALVLTWLLAIVAYVALRFWSEGALRTRLAAALRTSGDVRADLEKLERATPKQAAAEIVDLAEVASVATPLAGLSLLLPLSLHLVVWLLFSNGRLEPAAFDKWIGYSVACAGLSHLTLAGFCWRFAARARRSSIEEVKMSWRWAAFGALGWSALAAVLPTIIFAPVLVILTGAVPVPLMFKMMVGRLTKERAALSEALA